jgi:hypothetical protein
VNTSVRCISALSCMCTGRTELVCYLFDYLLNEVELRWWVIHYLSVYVLVAISAEWQHRVQHKLLPADS